MSNGKLVYTTDKSNPSFLNNLSVGTMESKEVQTVKRSIINEISASLPNTKGAKGRMKKPNPRSEESLKRVRSQFTDLVNFLWTERRSPQQVKKAMNLDGNKFSNFMQKAREASKGIIQTKNGVWLIIPGYQSPKNDLIEMMIENRNAVWINSVARKKEREAQGIQNNQRKIKAKEHTNTSKIQHVSVEGKTFIQRFSSTGFNAEVKIESTVHAVVSTYVGENSIIVEIKQ